MRAARARIDVVERAGADFRITERLEEVLEGREVVAGFVPVKREVAAPQLWFERRGGEARVALPRCGPGVGDMTFHEVGAWPSEPGAYGIPEPAAGAPQVLWTAIDAVLVPGLAFDARGHRLGYGAGYYDRALPKLRADALRVGVCYAVQYLDEVPVAAHDVPVDLVVTERFVIDTRPRQGERE